MNANDTMETIGIEYQQQMVLLINMCARPRTMLEHCAVDSACFCQLAQFISTDMQRMCSHTAYDGMCLCSSKFFMYARLCIHKHLRLIRRLPGIIARLNHCISHIFLCHAYKYSRFCCNKYYNNYQYSINN